MLKAYPSLGGRTRRRHQQPLVAIAHDEVLRHPEIVLSPADGAHGSDHVEHARRGAGQARTSRLSRSQVPRPFDVCDDLCPAALSFSDQRRGTNPYLVWTNFADWTTEPGGTETVLVAIPRAAAEWLNAEGDPDAEQSYFDRGFRFHQLGVAP